MNLFADGESRRKKDEEALRGVPDEDGFITVQRTGVVKTGSEKVQVIKKEVADAIKPKDRGLTDFYRFQFREQKRNGTILICSSLTSIVIFIFRISRFKKKICGGQGKDQKHQGKQKIQTILSAWDYDMRRSLLFVVKIKKTFCLLPLENNLVFCFQERRGKV